VTNSILEFIKEFFGVILALLGTGGLSGWLLTRYKYNREKEQRKAHLKANLLDDILNQCRKIEKHLNGFPEYLSRFRRYIEDDSIDPETGYPNNIFDFETESEYHSFISQLDREKEKLRHLHQDYVIKTKSSDLPTIKAIDESLTKITNYKVDSGFNFDNAFENHLMVITNLRTIYHEIKEHYPEEVPVEK